MEEAAESGKAEMDARAEDIRVELMELEETLMLWKGQSHVTNWFDDARDAEKVKKRESESFKKSAPRAHTMHSSPM